MQATQGAALFGNQQHAGGIAVETVYQLEEASVRTQSTKPLDDAKAEATATVHCHARGLVQHDHRLVFEQDLALQTLDNPQISRRQFIFFGNADRGHPYHVTRAEFVLRFDALFVYPHFAFAKDAIDQALGDAL